MMLYSAFAILVNHWWPWFYLFLVWSIVFSLRMLIKEGSLRKKPGYEEYAARSWILIPKFGGSFLISWTVYVILIGAFVMVYFVGGGVENFFGDFKQGIEHY